ncbi:hypothetical protein Vspart_03618 [Vibrio spartinae]|uniref:SMP domain-containing protein n=3 Tax=Vibrio TaxID=662 RepID=A0ABX6R3X4_9VIBR|nr:hypothetical protein [Vibrio gazogenes]ASA57948.1 hypothetical protein BSQ33_19775 [Vibrio gazogenes]QMV16233.1 hypothetical protein Vspart_03618 [Vibrio spartinae]
MSKNKAPMTPEAAARIQANQAKQNGGQIDKDSFAARAQRAAANNQKPDSKAQNMTKENPNYPSKTGNPSGKGRGNTPKR